MQAERGASIHLDIPFYRQHYDFTCGPASINDDVLRIRRTG